jgi:Delta3-Delta2-enoyl-CoA isomerase
LIEIIEHGAVRELRLARPPVNALSPELIVALGRALDEAVASPRPGEPAPGAPRAEPVGAVVLSGAPGMFSAGLDVPHLLTLDRDGIRAMWHEFYGLLRRLAVSPLPVLAAITGHCPAGGAVVTLYCDARIMADGEFQIGVNEVRVGLPMPAVIVGAMRRLLGPRLAERLCVAGTLVAPAEAARLGLVDEVVPAGQVVARAVGLAQELAALPRTAMSETRRLARADLVALFAGGTEAALDETLDAWFSAEAQATMRALVERLARKRTAHAEREPA